MFAYEYYKRNLAVLRVGIKKPDDENILKPIGNKDGKKIFTSEIPETTPTICCFYESMPKFNFESGFSADDSELLKIINTIRNAWEAGTKAWDSLKGNDNLGFNKETFKAITDALTEGYAITGVPSVQRWSKQGPVVFTVKLIFLDMTGNGGPVYFDEKIKTLLALATFKDVKHGHLMEGPIGFNGTVSNVNKLATFLSGEDDSLHSLSLYKGQTTSGGTKVLDLNKILVVTDVKLATSEQLYVHPEGKQFPAYKWITAEVRFSTVCPLPSPFSVFPTNVSNLYGHRSD